MQSANVIPTSVKMPTELKARIQQLADCRDKSVHSLMLQAIESFVEREEKREKLRQDAIKAHENYIQTGLHVTSTEANTWLESLANGQNTEPPKCHL